MLWAPKQRPRAALGLGVHFSAGSERRTLGPLAAASRDPAPEAEAGGELRPSAPAPPRAAHSGAHGSRRADGPALGGPDGRTCGAPRGECARTLPRPRPPPPSAPLSAPGPWALAAPTARRPRGRAPRAAGCPRAGPAEVPATARRASPDRSGHRAWRRAGGLGSADGSPLPRVPAPPLPPHPAGRPPASSHCFPTAPLGVPPPLRPLSRAPPSPSRSRPQYPRPLPPTRSLTATRARAPARSPQRDLPTLRECTLPPPVPIPPPHSPTHPPSLPQAGLLTLISYSRPFAHICFIYTHALHTGVSQAHMPLSNSCVSVELICLTCAHVCHTRVSYTSLSHTWSPKQSHKQLHRTMHRDTAHLHGRPLGSCLDGWEPESGCRCLLASLW